jgi:excisionase family DNA binding protein
MNETLTPIEAGLYLNLHVRTICRLAKKGLIPALKVNRRWRFRKAALEEWLLCMKTTPGKNEATI